MPEILLTLYTADSFGLGYDSNDLNTAKARESKFLVDTSRFKLTGLHL
jgi:hypothetical protein